MDDVEPFMCTYGGCSQNYRTYSDRKDWEAHENDRHRIASKWICHDCDEEWNTSQSFKEHLKLQHKDSVADESLDIMAKMCKVVRSSTAPRKRCILCGDNMTTVQGEYDHIASHLLDLALFVLPKIDAYVEQQPLEMDDSRSDVLEDPPGLEGLEWFQNFKKDEVVPFEKLEMLGAGAFGNVSAMRYTGNSAATIFACRTNMIRGPRRKDDEKRFRQEVKISSRLRHVHLISTVGAYIQGRAFVIVQYPVFDRGTLADLLREESKDAKQPVLERKWFGCLASALQYLHENRVRHQDIKPSNIGIMGQAIVLSDLAIAKGYSDASSDTDDEPVAYTYRYAPPEVITWQPRSRSADVFSLGAVFFEMLWNLSQVPFKDLQGRENRGYGQDYERLQGLLTDLKAGLPAELGPVWKICCGMMSHERNERPTAEHVLDSLIDASRNAGSLGVSGRSFVGKCVTSRLEEEPREDEAEALETASVNTLKLY